MHHTREAARAVRASHARVLPMPFPAPAPRLLAAAAALLDRARRGCHVLRAVAGAPDYEGYVAHCRATGAPALDRAAFERDRLAARYDRPGSRCC